MATVKSYTDLSQSKVLAKILKIESADMYWDYDYSINNTGKYKYYPMVMDDQFDDVCIPCWSLAALLNILPRYIRLNHDMRNCYDNLIYKGEQYNFGLERCSGGIIGKWYTQYQGIQERRYGKRYQNTSIKLYVSKEYDNPVDACVEMIVKLHEQKLL